MEWWSVIVSIATTLAATGIGALVTVAFRMNTKLAVICSQLTAGEARMHRHSERLDKHDAELDAHELEIDRLKRPTSKGDLKTRRT